MIEFIKQRKRRLLTKILCLGLELSENGNSAKHKRTNSADAISESQSETMMNSAINCEYYKEQVPSLIAFLTYFCETFEDINSIASNGIESACQEILQQCQVDTDVQGCNIHNSMFYEHIFKNPYIKVSIIHYKNKYRT